MARVVLITGCSSGIGLETALAFARVGDTVCATMRNLSRAEKLQEAANAEDLKLAIYELDVAKPKSFAVLVDKIVQEFGGVDVLVNNAGVLPIGAFEDESEADLRHVMETNFFGPALLTKAVLPTMRDRQGGYIINVSSLSGMASKGGDATYAASKFALEGLCEGYRNEIARWNIKTALVEPGQYATNIFRGSDEEVGSGHRTAYHAYNEWLHKSMEAGAGGGNSPARLSGAYCRNFKL